MVSAIRPLDVVPLDPVEGELEPAAVLSNPVDRAAGDRSSDDAACDELSRMQDDPPSRTMPRTGQSVEPFVLPRKVQHRVLNNTNIARQIPLRFREVD